MTNDQRWMSRALELAQRGAGKVTPNPMVGAVLVRGGRVVGEGYHHAYGQDHAEVDAIKRAGTKARGATLYVNLEPCAHWGKTPPCMIAVAGSGIREVVAAVQDPNPRVAGQGFAYLKKHGVRVRTGVLEREARELNKVFFTWVTKRRPFVTIKAATTLDGRMATVSGESKWITGKPAREVGHRLRTQVDAIAVGANTVLKDNPTLTSHGLGRNPIRIIFAGRQSLPRGLNIFNRAAATWVMKNIRGVAPLRKALNVLAGDGISHLLVEGGPTLQQSFLEAGCVDEVVWFIAPMIFGKIRKLSQAKRFKEIEIGKIGEDLCLRGSFRPSEK
jgi:diaminohydroxyphosphoribosylaminopyrimidine deaminase/5-amino-6-(5-phosphoribosylamino)uracil reductase